MNGLEQLDAKIAKAREQYCTAMSEYALARLEAAVVASKRKKPFPYKERYEALSDAIAQGRLIWKEDK